MLDVLEKAINKSSVDFIETRLVESWSTRIKVRNDEIGLADSGYLMELGVRVLSKGSWGFSSANSMSKLDECVKSAEKLAKASSKNGIDAHLADVPVTVTDLRMKVEQDPLGIDIEDKAKRCLALSKRGTKEDKVVATDVFYMDGSSKWFYANSEGSRISYNPITTFFMFNSFVKDGQLMSYGDQEAGGYGFELMKGKEQMVDKVSEDARLLLRSELAPKGKQAVVIDHEMAGTLAHEAVGHALEADTIINKNSVITKLGQHIGSELVYISDDPIIPREFGSYPFDSEGVPSMKTLLVEQGKVKGFMHSRETAHKTRQGVTGNARSAGPGEFPLVRMSNTLFEPGNMILEEILKEIGNGVYVRGFKGGVVDTDTGFFQFAAPHGNLIENGELGKPLRDITILGNIIETLKHVSAVGNDLKTGFPGMCGKAGQNVPVSGGGPHIGINEVLVG